MSIAGRIEHTLLKAETNKKSIDQLINEAKEYKFRGVCVNGSWIKYVKEKLNGTGILTITTIAFPLGATMTQAKVHEAELAIKHGADEVDMVINVGMLKDGQTNYILQEINKVKDACGKKVLKVIIETALLSKKEIEDVTKIILQSNADFIKTSTGFSFSGAKLEDIILFKKILGNAKKIKASAGIKNLDDALKMIQAGADTIGTSSGVAIVKEETNNA